MEWGPRVQSDAQPQTVMCGTSSGNAQQQTGISGTSLSGDVQQRTVMSGASLSGDAQQRREMSGVVMWQNSHSHACTKSLHLSKQEVLSELFIIFFY